MFTIKSVMQWLFLYIEKSIPLNKKKIKFFFVHYCYYDVLNSVSVSCGEGAGVTGGVQETLSADLESLVRRKFEGGWLSRVVDCGQKKSRVDGFHYEVGRMTRCVCVKGVQDGRHEGYVFRSSVKVSYSHRQGRKDPFHRYIYIWAHRDPDDTSRQDWQQRRVGSCCCCCRPPYIYVLEK